MHEDMRFIGALELKGMLPSERMTSPKSVQVPSSIVGLVATPMTEFWLLAMLSHRVLSHGVLVVPSNRR